MQLAEFNQDTWNGTVRMWKIYWSGGVSINSSIDSIYPKIFKAMLVRAIAPLRINFLKREKNTTFPFHFNRKLYNSKQMTT